MRLEASRLATTSPITDTNRIAIPVGGEVIEPPRPPYTLNTQIHTQMNKKHIGIIVGIVTLGLAIYFFPKRLDTQSLGVAPDLVGSEQSMEATGEADEGSAFSVLGDSERGRRAEGGYLPDLYKFDPDWNYDKNRPRMYGETYTASTTSPEKEALFKAFENPDRPGYPETAEQLLLSDEALPQFDLWLRTILEKANADGKGWDIPKMVSTGGGKPDQDFAKGLLRARKAFPEDAAIMDGVTAFDWWEAVEIIAEATDPPTEAPRKLWHYRGTEFDPTVNGGKTILHEKPAPSQDSGGDPQPE